MKLLNFKQLEHKKIWNNGMMGMTYGFIGTLIVGTIIGFLSINQDNQFSYLINNIKKMLYYVCPFAIGVGVGVQMKFNIFKIFALGIASFIIGHSQIIPKFENETINWTTTKIAINEFSLSPGDVFGAFMGAMFITYVFKIIVWRTLFDILITPIIGIFLGILGMMWITYLTSSVLVVLKWIIFHSINKNYWIAILLAPVVGTLMGLALSFPTSSAAIAFSLSLSGYAATAAMGGTAGQMIAFGIMTYKGNKKVSSAMAVGLTTSMLQMKNFSRHRKLLIIPCLVSAVSATFAVIAFPLEFPMQSPTSGMGTSGLYGPIFTLKENGWNNYNAYLNVFIAQIIVPIILTFTLSYLLIDYWPLIKREWLII